MKRIIDGATYNTDTSTVVAEGGYEDEARGAIITTTLYQNRAGVFFSVDEIETSYRDRNDDIQTRTAYEWYVVGDRTKAQEWCEKHGLTIIQDFGEMPPEAQIEAEPAATLYVRVPSTLKRQVDKAAQDDELSGNAWAMRCIEKCLSLREIRDIPELGHIWEIATTFSVHTDGQWTRETCIKALTEISEYCEEVGQKLFGADYVIGEHVDFHNLTSERIKKEYRPYAD